MIGDGIHGTDSGNLALVSAWLRGHAVNAKKTP